MTKQPNSNFTITVIVAAVALVLVLVSRFFLDDEAGAPSGTIQSSVGSVPQVEPPRQAADFLSEEQANLVPRQPTILPPPAPTAKELEDLPNDFKRSLIDPPPPLPPEMEAQLRAPPPELPEDLRRQLEAGPIELPEDLRRQLAAPPPELPEDIKRALQTPPRVVTEEEVNSPSP